MSRHRVSFAVCGTGEIGKRAASVALLAGAMTLIPEAAAAQGRLTARANVVPAVASWEGLAASDSVGRIDMGADALLVRRRVDGAITSVFFWYALSAPEPSQPDRAALASGRSPRADSAPAPAPTPGPGIVRRVARVQEIHYLRN